MKAHVVPLVLIGVFVLLSTAGPGWGLEWRVWLRDSSGHNYYSDKTYASYQDTSQSTCHESQPWCLKTENGNVKLRHYHFVDAYTGNEAADADRYANWSVGYDQVLQTACTWFNCHSYALYGNGSVWCTDQPVALSYDFDEVVGDKAIPIRWATYATTEEPTARSS